MTTTETVNPNTDPVPNTDLPNPENSQNQEDISLKGHLLLAALSDGEDIKNALDPEKKLDQGTIDAMRGKRLGTAEVKREYNPIVNGLSVHERTEKWKGKNFQDAYSEWSTNLLGSINQSESRERKDLISKFFGKDFSEVKDEDIKVLYDQYCHGGSNVDDFVKKAVEGESSSTEVEWLAKKLFGTKSGETVKKIFEIEVDIKKAGSIDNALRKANEMFWQSGLDRFNNPNKEEEEILKLLFGNFGQAQKKTDEDNEGAPPASATEEPSETSTTDIPTPSENPESSEPKKEEADEKDNGTPKRTAEESNETPAIIAIPTDEAAAEEQSEKTDEEYNGAPPPTGEAEKETPDESPNSITEAEAVKSIQTPEPSIQPDIIEPDKTTEPPSMGGSLNDTPGTAESNQPDAVEPTPEPTGGTWPPAEVEPIGNPAGSIWQRIKGKFSR